VTFQTGRVALDQRGRMRHHEHGVEVAYSYVADYPAFRRWLADTIATPLASGAVGKAGRGAS
jgi:hypothetical protein